MDAKALIPLLEQLDDNIDDLEEVLEPFLGQSLSTTSKNLPVLDKAQFNVLITYTLESLIFSFLRLHGVDAMQHPVFRELTRLRQYSTKIKALEDGPEQRTMTLDKDAAGRFIKHGLAGNDKIDLQRAEKEAKEKARASLKAALLAKKNALKSQESPAQTDDSTGPASAAAQSDGDSGDSSDEEMGTEPKVKVAGNTEFEKQEQKSKANKSKKRKPGHEAARNAIRNERRAKKAKARREQKAKNAS